MGARWTQVAGFAAAALVALPARAQDQDQAAAQVLFDDARNLMNTGDYEQACPKLMKARKLYPGTGVLLNLADCYEHLGRTASAWIVFGEAASAAERAGRSDDEAEARLRQAALDPKLSKLVVHVAIAPQGLIVKRDGKELDSAKWGIEIPVDPGLHTVSAQAPGLAQWSRAVNVSEPGGTVTVDLPNSLVGIAASMGAVPPPGPRLRHFWIGAAVSLDLQTLPGANDTCLLNANAVPGNPDYYCVDSTGNDYPTRMGAAQNSSILVGRSDKVPGGITAGNLRLLASFDYAVNYNLLFGVRLGYAGLDYPGRAYSEFPPVHIEGRATYVFGHEALMTQGFAPIILLAGGGGQFSSNVGVTVFECDTRAGAPVGAVVNNGRAGSATPGIGERCPARSADRAGSSHDLSAWRVAGPGFIAPGGGIRYAFSDSAAVSVNLKLAIVFGNGFMFAPAPEAAVQYGF